MDVSWLLALSCILLLVFFDFTNGFHDTANMVASVLACRAMTPGQAILLHGGEAQAQRDAFAALPEADQANEPTAVSAF